MQRASPPSTTAPPGQTRAWLGLGLGLLCSGVAGVVNQVVWQRALKVSLGGSETLSSLTVVVVFLLGLGLGAALAGQRADRARSPLRALAAVELGLAAVNMLVAVVLGLDLSETVYGAQRLAVSAGIPLRLVYALGAAVVLLPPTLLMGATVPLASAGAQRQLGAKNRGLVPLLFATNTLGAAAGAAVASLWWLPWYGQRAALVGALSLNLLAGLLVAVLARRPAIPTSPASAPTSATPIGIGGRLRREDGLGFALGFLSLGYEMLMLRALLLAHGPLPTTFASGLCAFLVAWAAGVGLANRALSSSADTSADADAGAGAGAGGGGVALAVGVGVALLPGLLPLAGLSLPLGAGLLALPVVGFGWLYGLLVSRRAESWGPDVGLYSALNTVGSCLGALFFTLVGYDVPLSVATLALGLGLVAVAAAEVQAPRERPLARGVLGVALLAGLGVLLWGLSLPRTILADGALRYWGRDGVVEVSPDGDIYLDGLWHTRLISEADEQIGRPYTWVMAAAAVLAHGSTSGDRAPQRALVIGAGVGVSGMTLAGVEGLQVDGYEINHTLRRLLEDEPARTLGALHHPQLRWIWRDARTGLALDETQYDIILSAPLHLKQAGASLLLSQEYLRLVRSRLAPDGVLAVYSNEGVPAQTQLIQRTLAEAFAYRASFYDGLVTIAADVPITIDGARVAARMARTDRLAAELRAYEAQSRDTGGVLGLWDGDTRVPLVAQMPISDDWPLIEYPDLATRLVEPAAAAATTSRP